MPRQLLTSRPASVHPPLNWASPKPLRESPILFTHSRQMSRSEHNLSDAETSPDLGTRRSNGSRFTRGVFNDVDTHARRSHARWTIVTSTLKTWSSRGLAKLRSVDWKGNGRLVRALS